VVVLMGVVNESQHHGYKYEEGSCPSTLLGSPTFSRRRT